MPAKGRRPKPKDETREVLIKHARNIFTKNGFQKSNIDDIALLGGKGKSTIYYYFNSKEDIYKAVVESELNDLRNNIIDEVNLATDPLNKIKAYILTRINFLSNYKNLCNTIREHSVSRFSYTENIRQKFDSMEVEILTSILKDGVKDGYFKINEPGFVATGLIAALCGVQLQLFTTTKKSGFDLTLDNLLEILLFGLIK